MRFEGARAYALERVSVQLPAATLIMNASLFIHVAALVILLMRIPVAAEQGVIDDPDGFTHVRSAPRADSAVVTKVKSGEPFNFEPSKGSDWWKVVLSSGTTGWMHSSRILLHHRLEDMPAKDEEGSEIGEYAKGKGFDYNATARAAAQGDANALKRFFGIKDTDGAAAESHAYTLGQVIHILGDAQLAAFLDRQPREYQIEIRNQLTDFVPYPFDSRRYLERHFPKTTHVLCRKEVVDWPSPDGRYFIRKVFRDAFPHEGSTVTQSELLERASGKVVAVLTQDDIGSGPHREGRVLWSPDSKRLALFSGAPASDAQTVVYQSDGTSFTRVPSADAKLPGRDVDAELKKAKHLWQHVEPIRWTSPDVLVLQHHDYFEAKGPNGSIHSIGRTYEITRNLATGEATAKVMRFDE